MVVELAAALAALLVAGKAFSSVGLLVSKRVDDWVDSMVS